jgi:hypothetical protein
VNEFIIALRNFGIQERFKIKRIKNEKARLTDIFAADGCCIDAFASLLHWMEKHISLRYTTLLTLAYDDTNLKEFKCYIHLDCKNVRKQDKSLPEYELCNYETRVVR